MHFTAYSDDSGSSDKRYRCVTVVSSDPRIAGELKSSLASCLADQQMDELKFQEIRGHAPKMKGAGLFLRQAVDLCSRGKIRIDVLLWDNQDSRHSLQRRDDDANVARMYYKVLVHGARQWSVPQWQFFPDEQSGIDWEALRAFLNATRLIKFNPSILTLFGRTNPFLQFAPFEPKNSIEEPLVQLADLFGGLSRFSREKGRQFLEWRSSKEAEKQLGLFMIDPSQESSDSNADKARFSLLRQFDKLCKGCKLGVSVQQKGYLWTPQPSSPINFWSYVPQHEDDKAPTRA